MRTKVVKQLGIFLATNLLILLGNLRTFGLVFVVAVRRKTTLKNAVLISSRLSTLTLYGDGERTSPCGSVLILLTGLIWLRTGTSDRLL